nr:hypothetical protein CFP56_26296 [Quercus suber]
MDIKFTSSKLIVTLVNLSDDLELGSLPSLFSLKAFKKLDLDDGMGDLGEILGVVSESEESFDDDLQHASLEAEKLAVDIEEFQVATHKTIDMYNLYKSLMVFSITMVVGWRSFPMEQEEPQSQEESLDGKGSTPLPVLCIEDGMVICRFSEIFGIHEPLKKGEKRDRRFSIPKAFFIAFLFSSINVALEARHLLDTAKASSKAPTLQVVPPVPKPKLPPLPPLPSILTSPPHASPESREPKKALSSPPSQLPPAPSSNTPTSPELPKPKIALSSPQPSQLAPAPSSTPPTSPEEPKPKKDVVSPPPSQLPPTPSSIAPTSPPQVPPSTSTSLTPTISPLAPPHPTFPKLILPPLPHLELPPLTKPILPKLPPLPSIIPPVGSPISHFHSPPKSTTRHS